MITPDDLFRFADLADMEKQSEVAIRRAISAAYYAAFHAVAQAGSEMFSGSAQLRTRLSRSYDHGAVRTMAGEMQRQGRQAGADPAFALLAQSLQSLQETREVADYDLRAELTWKDGLDSVADASEVLSSIAALKADPAFAELILLPLLRDRKRRG